MRIIICDDNEMSRKMYVTLLHKLARKHNIELIVEEYESGEQLVFEYEDRSSFADIIFLDIMMPKMDGLEVARKLKEYNCQSEVVFLTVSPEYVFNAFDVQAFNYILKDKHSMGRFESIFLRAVEAAEEKKKEYMLFSGVGETRNVAINSINYFETLNKIVIVHYNKETFEFVSTLGKLENLLFTYGFIRVHRSFLVSAQYIQSYSSREIRLFDETVIPIGRRYYGNLKEAMKERRRLK